MDEQIKKVMAVGALVEELNIPASRANISKLDKIYQLLWELEQDLQQPAEVKDNVCGLPGNNGDHHAPG